MNKYGNRKTMTPDGIVHDSKKEAQRWMELLLMQRGGLISNLRRQVEFELIPAQYETYERYGKKGNRLSDGLRLVERACCYVADFVYDDAESGKMVVEDAKGKRTKDYIIKRKLMLHIKKIKVREV